MRCTVIHPSARAFTMIELMVSMVLGLLVAGGAVVGLKNVVAIGQADTLQTPSWIVQADRLLYQDIQQASRIESSSQGLVIYTVAPSDLFSETKHEPSIVTYEVVSIGRQQWWVRRGKPEVVLSNRKVPGLLIGPATNEVSLRVQISGAPPLRWGSEQSGDGKQGSISGTWQVGAQAPSGGFVYIAQQEDGVSE